MRESYWEKELADGTRELGSDRMIVHKVASWTRGRQDIVSTSLCFQNQTIRIICPLNDGQHATWRQLDNFVFSPSSGESRRLSREVWCSPNGYKRFSRVRTPGMDTFAFGDNCHAPVPDNVSFLVCSIGIDGKVSYRWS